MAGPAKNGKKFEKKLADLEEIVSKLESGDLPLEDSLAFFEKGTVILRELTRILEEAERKVEVLTRDMKGTLGTETFEEDGDE